MITATILEGQFKGQTFEVDGLANRGDWFHDTWIVGIGMGFETAMIVVEGDNETDIIDALTDSKYGHLIKVEDDFYDDPDYAEYGGNNGHLINTDEIRIFARCKVHYFEKRVK